MLAGALTFSGLETRAETKHYEVPSGTTNITSKAVTGPGGVELIRSPTYRLRTFVGEGIQSVSGNTNAYFRAGSTNLLSVSLSPDYENPFWKTNGVPAWVGSDFELIVSGVTDVEVSASKIVLEGSVFRFR